MSPPRAEAIKPAPVLTCAVPRSDIVNISTLLPALAFLLSAKKPRLPCDAFDNSINYAGRRESFLRYTTCVGLSSTHGETSYATRSRSFPGTHVVNSQQHVQAEGTDANQFTA